MIVGGVSFADSGCLEHNSAAVYISCVHVSSWSKTSTQSDYFFSSFIMMGMVNTSDLVDISLSFIDLVLVAT